MLHEEIDGSREYVFGSKKADNIYKKGLKSAIKLLENS